MKKIGFIISLLFVCFQGFAQHNEIIINTSSSLGEISPFIFGQFIEYMGRCIDGGVYDEKSPASNDEGIRLDVLEKVQELAPTMIRFPGGTFIKTFHWEDGVGPKEQRKAKKNLIWGGINSFHFGTCEFIEYCRTIHCEPVLVINLATGSPEEAANWVEYCNGNDDTYYANLRRSHGYEEPFNVKYWALGNEEAAEPDAGRHQSPHKYVEDVWHFVKLMKLTDPTIELIADGERGNKEWNETILKGLDGAIDYLSFHGYVSSSRNPYSIFRGVDRVGEDLKEFAQVIKDNSTFPVQQWKKWYRFPHRTKPIKIAMDEWGIWEQQEPPYGTTNTYEWRHALATAYYLNTIIKNADKVGMANWAQMVNILAPIMTDANISVRQTVFFPLKEYRANALKECVDVQLNLSEKVDKDLNALNVIATIDKENKALTLFVVNISPLDVKTAISFPQQGKIKLRDVTTLSSTSLNAKNSIMSPEKNVVTTTQRVYNKKIDEIQFRKESINICRFDLD